MFTAMSKLEQQTKNDGRLRSAYLWNTAGSMLNAFQSVIMLMVITRVADLVTAGVFTLAYANANLFLNLGSFGMRTFEASDSVPQHGFRAYAISRFVTALAMVICSWGWLAWSAYANAYDADKTFAVALMTLMKGMDTVEDVFDGSFQQSGRLDVAGRQLTFRVLSTIVVFCVTIALTRSLVMATAIGFVWTTCYLLVSLFAIKRNYGLPVWHPEAPNQSPWPLLHECVPLFLAAFLLFYVGNAPKYGIDAMMDDATQAIYGFIAMPVFVVGLLSQFVYMPLVQPLSQSWAEGDAESVKRAFLRQVGVVFGITLACVIAAALLGPPVLGVLYATDLGQWRLELCLLVAGGGLLALASLFTMGMTIIREQRRLLLGYTVVAIMAFVVSGPMVGRLGVLGASLCYVGCMAVLALWFAALFAWCIHTRDEVG